jgi:hypothetical protein
MHSAGIFAACVILALFSILAQALLSYCKML